MAEINTVIAEASQDLQTIEDFVNLPAGSDVRPRLLPSVNVGTLSGIRDAIFENGGLPATPFATKALMTASALIDGDFAQVTDDTVNNGLYVKTAGAWVKSGYDPLTQAKVYSNEISKQNLRGFFEPSKNMYNHATTQVGQTINTSGDLSPLANGGASDFIEVKPNSTYHFKVNYYWNFSYVSFYDESKQFIKRDPTAIASGETNFTLTTLSNASYIRISLNLANFSLSNTMLSETPIDVVTPYSLPVLKNAIASSEFKADIINDADKLIKIATMDSSSFINDYIEKSDNLFNYQDVEIRKVISSSGEVVAHNTSSFVSNYINVNAGESYTVSGDFSEKTNLFSYVAYYNADKVFVSRGDMTIGAPTVLVIPMGVAYIRIMSNLFPERYSRMLNKGATALPYEPYGMVLKDIPTSLDFKKSLRQKYYYDTNLNLTYSTTRDFTKYKTIPTGTAEAVYSAFDALMASSDGYITKQRLRDSVQGREISAYFLKPPTVRDSLHLIEQEDKRPTVFVLCSVHGHEHLPAFAGYALAAELCDNYRSDDVLSALRYNANIIIIPVGNPDGWGINSRKNANGIDVARNFPTSTWILREPSSGEYGGAEPASEPETLNIMQVITENSIDIFYDFHNYMLILAQIQTGPFSWILPPYANDKKTAQLARTLSTRMTRKLQKEFAYIPDNWESGYSELADHAMPMVYAHEKGVPITCTFELSKNLPDFKGDGTNSEGYATDHARITFEFFVNWLLICLDGVKEP